MSIFTETCKHQFYHGTRLVCFINSHWWSNCLYHGVWQLCDALSQKLPDWIEPPWMTALKKLAVDNADQEVPSEPGQDSELPQLDPMEPAENQTLDSLLDGEIELSRPASAESAESTDSAESADTVQSVIFVKRCVPLGPLEDASETQNGVATFSQQAEPCDVGNGKSGRNSPIGWGTCEEFHHSGNSSADRLNDPVLPEETNKKKKKVCLPLQRILVLLASELVSCVLSL